jgi:hypothetical protein
VSFYGVNPDGSRGRVLALSLREKTLEKIDLDAHRFTLPRAALLRLVLRAWYDKSESTRRRALVDAALELVTRDDGPLANPIPFPVGDDIASAFEAERRARGVKSRSAMGRLIVHAYLFCEGGLVARRQDITNAATREAIAHLEQRIARGRVLR